MARVNVYLPDGLAKAVREGGVNVSNVTQVAVERELVRRSTSSWLRRVALERGPGVPHRTIVEATRPAGSEVTAPPTVWPTGSPGEHCPRARRNGVAHVVLHVSAALDLMLASDLGFVVESAIDGCVVHAPASFDRDVLAALGRLVESGLLGARVFDHVETLEAAPIERHPLSGLLAGAWDRRQALDVDRALYAELATQLRARLIASDACLNPSGLPRWS